MRPDASHWRIEAAYDFVDSAGAHDLAWECLRRNAGYQQDYAGLKSRSRLDLPLPFEMEAHWGLRFRRTARIVWH